MFDPLSISCDITLILLFYKKLHRKTENAMKICGIMVLLVTLAGHIQGMLRQIIICSLLKTKIKFLHVQLYSNLYCVHLQ